MAASEWSFSAGSIGAKRQHVDRDRQSFDDFSARSDVDAAFGESSRKKRKPNGDIPAHNDNVPFAARSDRQSSDDENSRMFDYLFDQQGSGRSIHSPVPPRAPSEQDDPDAFVHPDRRNNFNAHSHRPSRRQGFGGAPPNVYVDVNNGENKFERTIQFQAHEMGRYKHLIGDDIRQSAAEAEGLRGLEEQLRAARAGEQRRATGGDGGQDDDDRISSGSRYGGAGNAQDFARMFAEGMRHADGEGGGRDGSQQIPMRSEREGAEYIERKRHENCVICKHTCLPLGKGDRDFENAHRKMTIYDLEKCGFIPDVVLFKEMRDVFNREQFFMGQYREEVVKLTVADVQMHYTHHDMTNPLRRTLTHLRLFEEMLQEGAKFGFGLVDGHKFMNSNKITSLMKISKRCEELQRTFMNLRAQITQELEENYGAEAAGNGGGPASKKKSRHQNGTAAAGRFATNHLL